MGESGNLVRLPRKSYSTIGVLRIVPRESRERWRRTSLACERLVLLFRAVPRTLLKHDVERMEQWNINSK
jgi:hypothetical protein